MQRIKIKQTTSTTTPGFRNPHGQEVIRDTGWPSESFPGQRVYHLRCTHCGHDYGANGTDIAKRRCPRHQDGAPGERLREPGPSLFS